VANSPVTAIVPADGGQVAKTITNTRKLGSLEVTKTVNWNGVTPIPGQTFEICITGPSYPTTGNCKTADFDGTVLTWTGLIPGDYTVTETDPGTSWTTPVITDSPATVPTDGGQATATVENAWALGSLKISKTLVDGGSGYALPFKIDYSCALEGSPVITGTVSVAAGASQTAPPMPSGYVCTVTETLPGAPSGFTWATPVITDSPAAPIAKGETVAVTVANQLTANPTPPPPPPGPTPPPVVVTPIVPEPATVPEEPAIVPEPATVPEEPETVSVPEEATIPTAVNAGEGSRRPSSDVPLGVVALLILAVLAAAGVGTRLMWRRFE
jgi:hypothetical protein